MKIQNIDELHQLKGYERLHAEIVLEKAIEKRHQKIDKERKKALNHINWVKNHG